MRKVARKFHMACLSPREYHDERSNVRCCKILKMFVELVTDLKVDWSHKLTFTANLAAKLPLSHHMLHFYMLVET